MLENIPAELRALSQWVVCGTDKIPLNPRTGHRADVTNPQTWGTFAEATVTNMLVGFVLSAQDPFCIIDLDNKSTNPASPEEIARHERIITAFDSYTERSMSGTGYHIIVKGRIPTGAKRGHVEVYFESRFMVCTGNAVHLKAVAETQPLLDILYTEMQAGIAPAQELVEVDDPISDADLFDMATNAVNGDKFNTLCAGDMTGYPSQSEADFALLAILAYYTPSNEQVRRIFRMSRLGAREKATRDNVYLNRALGKIRAAQSPELSQEQMDENVRNLLATSTPPEVTPHAIQQGTTQEAAAGGVHIQTASKLQDLPQGEQAMGEPNLPPGLVGELAVYFYQTAVRPVPEVALAAAIGICAGVFGRSYNISGTGLNQYILLLAKTGSGKEGAANGIDLLTMNARRIIPFARDFVGPASFSSGISLVRHICKKPTFVSVLGEFGLTLQAISSPDANAADKSLRKILLSMYSKSGWSQTMESSVYADSEKNTTAVQAPNLTILGESTAENVFDGMGESHISEGLIPRFLFIEYKGQRPPFNDNANFPPSDALLRKFCDAMTVAISISNNSQCLNVEQDSDATTMFRRFNVECDTRMNGTESEVVLQLWNRAHLKALKLAALIAVGCNAHQPVVTAPIAQWAIDFVHNDIRVVSDRFIAGNVGSGNSKQVYDLIEQIKVYYTTAWPSLLKDEVHANLREKGIIAYSTISRRMLSRSSFARDKFGATNALKKTLEELVQRGVLKVVPAVQLEQKFKFHGAAYCCGTNWS